MLTRNDASGATSFAYDNANQLSTRSVDSSVAETFSFDDDGNLISRTLSADSATTAYYFDDLDRVAQIGFTTGALERNYFDADNLRKSTTAVDGTTTSFSYGLPPLTETSTGTGGAVQTALLIADQFRGFERGGSFFYTLTDALGTIRVVVDETPNVVFTGSFGPWGEVLSVSDSVPGGTPYDWVGTFGVRRDGDSGLVVMGLRMYDLNLQRFLSRDPLGGSSSNAYLYANDNPAQDIDPFGLKAYNRQECNRILDKIRNARKQIKERIDELQGNPRKLPPCKVGKPGESIAGHIGILFVGSHGNPSPILNYARLTFEYLTFCTDKTGPLPKWVTEPIPVYVPFRITPDDARPRTTPDQPSGPPWWFWVGVGVGGAITIGAYMTGVGEGATLVLVLLPK